MTNFLLLYGMMRRHTGRLETGAMLATLGKIALAGAVLAAVCVIAQRFLLPATTHGFDLKLIGGLLLTIALGAGVFFAVAYLFRIAEVHDLVTLVRRRLNKL
jgi:peptidoglycan biosynthesis protein MviN/MurJ (putative lipid II flippase)